MSQVYFVCATPGSSGNFLVKLLRNLVAMPAGMTKPTFSQTPPDTMTRDFWFDNVEVGNEVAIHVPYYPDYQKLRDRFPGCKIIVMTHTLPECTTLAATLWKSFFKESYEFGAEPFFKDILDTHSHLFSSTTLTPDQLTPSEIKTFVKILEYQKVLDGFHNLTIPSDTDVIEIKHKNFYFQPAEVRSQLETFTGCTFTEPAVLFHNEIVSIYLENFFIMSAGDEPVPVPDH